MRSLPRGSFESPEYVSLGTIRQTARGCSKANSPWKQNVTSLGMWKPVTPVPHAATVRRLSEAVERCVGRRHRRLVVRRARIATHSHTNARFDGGVAKRREPDQLQWEPLSTIQTPSGAAILPPATGTGSTSTQTSYGTIYQSQAKTLRLERATIFDGEGHPQIVDRPVQETEYVELGPSRVVTSPDPSLNSRLVMPQASSTAFSDQLQHAPPGLSVAEAKARVGSTSGAQKQFRQRK